MVLTGVLVGILFGAAICANIKRRPGQQPNPLDDPRLLHWTHIDHTRTLLANCIADGDSQGATAVANHLRDLHLLAYAQGWLGQPGDLDREDANRESARWN